MLIDLDNDDKQRCQWDEDCPDEGLGTSYPVCSSEICQLVTSECSYDTDCSVSVSLSMMAGYFSFNY